MVTAAFCCNRNSGLFTDSTSFTERHCTNIVENNLGSHSSSINQEVLGVGLATRIEIETTHDLSFLYTVGWENSPNADTRNGIVIAAITPWSVADAVGRTFTVDQVVWSPNSAPRHYRTNENEIPFTLDDVSVWIGSPIDYTLNPLPDCALTYDTGAIGWPQSILRTPGIPASFSFNSAAFDHNNNDLDTALPFCIGAFFTIPKFDNIDWQEGINATAIRVKCGAGRYGVRVLSTNPPGYTWTAEEDS